IVLLSLSLHDALPIFDLLFLLYQDKRKTISYLLTFLKLQKSNTKQSRYTCLCGLFTPHSGTNTNCLRLVFSALHFGLKTLACQRSEEHTSELQSRENL